MGQKVTWGHLCCKIKSRATTTQTWNQKLSTFIKERIPERYSLKPKTDQKLKVLLGLIIINKKKKQQQLNSLFVFFPTQQQPWHSNMMSGKDLNLFDECPAEYVHLCTQEE